MKKNKYKLIRIPARITFLNYKSIKEYIDSEIENEKYVELDFEKSDTYSPLVIDFIVKIYNEIKLKDGDLRFANLGNSMLELIKLVGLDKLLTIREREKEC